MRTIEGPDELRALVGQEIGVSDWFAVDQDRINKFAGRRLELISAASVAGIAAATVTAAKFESQMSTLQATAAITGRNVNESTKAVDNLRRSLRLVVYVVLASIVVSVLFANWYAAAASLGLISLVLGFALKTPITSFIGWIYILAREPYRVGDRISIGEATGDVIDVTYLDTTLWEVGGPMSPPIIRAGAW